MRGSWTGRRGRDRHRALRRAGGPRLAAGLHPSISSSRRTGTATRTASPTGGVLVVGASATGVQLADELARRPAGCRAGRRAGTPGCPRRYRGMDIMWWLDSMGVLDRPVDDHRSRRPGTNRPCRSSEAPASRDVDLPSLAGRGVRLTGRVAGVDGDRVTLSDDLPRTTAAADAEKCRLLDRIDHFAAVAGLDAEVDLPTRAGPVGADRAGLSAVRGSTCSAAGIRTVIWATGYRRRYPWLQVPVLDAAGEIRHTAGRTAGARAVWSSVCAGRPAAAQRFSTVSGTTPRSSSTT